MKYLITALLLTCSSVSFAKATEVGNGGDAIVCKGTLSGKPTTVELLDYYEATTLRGVQLDLGVGIHNYKKSVMYVLDRLEKRSPKRAKLYKKYFADFHSEALFLHKTQFVDISDSNHVVIPNGCSVEQLAIQQEVKYLGDKRYLINKDLWVQMGERDKAGLILHEIVYREAIASGHYNSIPTRYFTGAISSKDYDKITDEEFVRDIQAIGFYTFEISGIKFNIFEKTSYKGVNGKVDCQSLPSNASSRMASYEFFPNGKLATGYLGQCSSVSYMGGKIDIVFNEDVYNLSSKVTFYENGNVEMVESYSKGSESRFSKAYVIVQGKSLPVAKRVVFWKNGIVKKAFTRIMTAIKLKDTSGQMHCYVNKYDPGFFEFDDKGYVIKGPNKGDRGCV